MASSKFGVSLALTARRDYEQQVQYNNNSNKNNNNKSKNNSNDNDDDDDDNSKKQITIKIITTAIVIYSARFPLRPHSRKRLLSDFSYTDHTNDRVLELFSERPVYSPEDVAAPMLQITDATLIIDHITDHITLRVL
ncbi:hypothetical protein PoB_001584400 [Plakobranchus ocellatus]|uniref:Uncharacterized protein n=1 Tax=Plakobranchus ocellatus TaxID=259542 RepID=A0AAV3Z1Z5_9GAST|nr:hypothetical protein PoB_001584400 [Plakobranchus ocellatus]